MTDAERRRLFDAARAAAVRGNTALQRDTRDEIVRLLRQAASEIRTTLAGQPTDYQLWSLPRLAAEIRRTLDDFGDRAGAQISDAAGQAWSLGEDLATKPLEAAGINLGATAIDTVQLQAMRSFMVDRIQDIGLDAANRIGAELGLVAIGAKAPSDAITGITGILGESSRSRATTIVRTELGRAFSAAAQAHMQADAEKLPGLQKQWRRSGKIHSRLHHDLADGQIVDVDQPFVVRPLGKSPVELMFPRDPAAPASETINCGCVSIPFMSSWQVAHPGRKPGGGGLADDGEPLQAVLGRIPAGR
jgi:hypothetical protein